MNTGLRGSGRDTRFTKYLTGPASNRNYPRFFIEKLSAPGDKVYDPFMGRGTTLLEAALLDRIPVGNDINPLEFHSASPAVGAAAARGRLAAVGFHPLGESMRM